MTRGSVTRYGSMAQFLRWCTAVPVLLAFISGPGEPEQLVYFSAYEFDRRFHETSGLCAFTLKVILFFRENAEAFGKAQ